MEEEEEETSSLESIRRWILSWLRFVYFFPSSSPLSLSLCSQS